MKESKCVLFLLVAVVLGGLKVSGADVLYIVPSQNHSFPAWSEVSCLTLQQFAEVSSRYNSTNLTLFLTDGKHDLNSTIDISDISAFSMISRDDTYDSTSIECGESANFKFSSVLLLHIRGLVFFGCENIIKYVHQLTIEDCTFLGTAYSGTSLTISESNVDITDTHFLSNMRGTYRDHVEFLPIHHGSTVGGAIIMTHSNVTVDNCLFEENKASVGGAIYAQHSSDMVMKSSDFYSNEAMGCDTGLCYGGALFLEESSSMTVKDCMFENNTSEGNGGVAVVINATLAVSHSHVSDNAAIKYGGVISTDKGGIVTIYGSNFTRNKAEGGGVISAQKKEHSHH